MVAPKLQENRSTAFDIHLRPFIKQLNIGLIFMLCVETLVTLFLKKIVGILFRSLVTGGIHHPA